MTVTLKRLAAVVRIRSLEALRDKTGLGSGILLPLLIVAGFAFAFSIGSVALFTVGVYSGAAPFDAGANAVLKDASESGLISVIPVASIDDGVARLRHHKIDAVLDLANRRYLVSESSGRAKIAEKLLQGMEIQKWRKETIVARPIRYVDWLLPGVLAMSMMFGGSYGVVYAVVRYRRNGVLKRLRATPLTAGEFIAGQLLARIWLVVGTTVLVFAVAKPAIGFQMAGAYSDLLLVLLLGALSLTGLGLCAAAWTESEEFAVNILNLFSWTMMFLSGIWFSPENVDPSFQRLALLLPLTHFVDAARAVMLYGAGIMDIASNLIALSAMSLAFIATGSILFRWR